IFIFSPEFLPIDPCLPKSVIPWRILFFSLLASSTPASPPSRSRHPPTLSAPLCTGWTPTPKTPQLHPHHSAAPAVQMERDLSNAEPTRCLRTSLRSARCETTLSPGSSP